jgi:hypothetical protein
MAPQAAALHQSIRCVQVDSACHEIRRIVTRLGVTATDVNVTATGSAADQTCVRS